jgi:hypothetical protein
LGTFPLKGIREQLEYPSRHWNELVVEDYEPQKFLQLDHVHGLGELPNHRYAVLKWADAAGLDLVAHKQHGVAKGAFVFVNEDSILLKKVKDLLKMAAVFSHQQIV